jgi:hypothetical protein
MYRKAARSEPAPENRRVNCGRRLRRLKNRIE